MILFYRKHCQTQFCLSQGQVPLAPLTYTPVVFVVDLYCEAIRDQIIQVRVLKYDSLDSLPYGACQRIFKSFDTSKIGVACHALFCFFRF